ncbi:MAG: hypothetical protein ACE5HT_13575, partial [Gemmatimonadales bacterium]
EICVQALVPVLGPIELGGSFGHFYNLDEAPSAVLNPNFRFSGWEITFTGRVRPFGRGSFLSLGYGVTAVHLTVRDRPTGVTVSNTTTTDVGLIGFEFPIWRIRPFVELRVLNILDENAEAVTPRFGLNVKLP